MKIEIITDIAEEPVSLSEVKTMLRITGSGHDSTVQSMIVAARKYFEKALQKSLGEKTLKVTSKDELEASDLPYGPNQEVTDAICDADGNHIYTYTTGYEEVPADIKQGIIYLIKYWYDIDDVAGTVPESVEKIIAVNTELPML